VVALVVVLVAFALFARFMLRPWLSHRLGGADIPNPPIPVAFAVIVAAGVPAGLIALTAGSSIVGLVVFLALLSAYSTVLAFRGFDPPK
jgi:hypothetical protein